MVEDAFTDLEFTPDNNHRHEALLCLTNGENDTAQPTDLNVLPSSSGEVRPWTSIRRSRYLPTSSHATLEPAVTSPHVRSTAGAPVCPLQSPLPPLTPLAEFSTPQGWGMSSPYGCLNPSLLLDTPNSLSQDQENDKLTLAAPHTLKESDSDRKENGQITKPSMEQAQCPDLRNRVDKKEVDHNHTRFNFAHDNTILRQGENLPDVRRRLFDESIENTTPNTTHTKQQLRENTDSILVEPQWARSKKPGLKSRITPPPPMEIPTNPLSKCWIQEMHKERTVAADKEIRLIQGTSGIPQVSSSYVGAQDKRQVERPAPIPQRIERPIHLPTFLQTGKTFSDANSEEKTLVMTSAASSVLAELKRQRSKVMAGRTKASSVAMPKSFKLSGPNERTCCNCKASQCIKRYCPCFATSNFCGPECGCRNCENTLDNSSCVGIARKALMERDPNAFVPRIRSSQRQKARGRQTIRGCNCRKGCEKNYCICKENGLVCGMRCTCSGPNGCQNRDESKLSNIEQVIENMPPPQYVDTGAYEHKAFEISPAEQSTKVQNDIHMNAKNSVPQGSQSCQAETPKTSTKSIVIDYPALPTPTTPSIPYNPFLGQDHCNKKRCMTFGNLSDGFKRIKVAKPNESSLPELRQSVHKFVTKPLAGLGNGSEANRQLDIPMTSKIPSTGTTPVDGRELTARDSTPLNASNGNDKLTGKETRSHFVPRILRYKFGSGKSVGPFENLR